MCVKKVYESEVSLGIALVTRGNKDENNHSDDTKVRITVGCCLFLIAPSFALTLECYQVAIRAWATPLFYYDTLGQEPISNGLVMDP